MHLFSEFLYITAVPVSLTYTVIMALGAHVNMINGAADFRSTE